MSTTAELHNNIARKATQLAAADDSKLFTIEWGTDAETGVRIPTSITFDGGEITIALYKLNSACSEGEWSYLFSDRTDVYSNPHSVIAVLNGASPEQASAYGKWKDAQDQIPAHRQVETYDIDWI